MTLIFRLNQLISKWRHEKDEQGRTLVFINSEEELQEYIQHPNKLPPGDLHIYSVIPLRPAHKALIDAMGKNGSRETIGLTGPPPDSVRDALVRQVRALLDNQLKTAAVRPPADQAATWEVASLWDSGGLLHGPAFWGDPEVGKLFLEAIGEHHVARVVSEAPDLHDPGPCPVEKKFREDLSSLLTVAAEHLQSTTDDLAREIALKCMGGVEGHMQPTLCESHGEELPYRLEVSHAFYHAMLVAARSCAARIRLKDSEERNITARDINDSLRWLVAHYLDRHGLPPMEGIANRMLPHQLLIVDRLVQGMRRFAIAHELGHALLLKSDGLFPKFNFPFDMLMGVVSVFDVPVHREDQWVDEIACDLLGIRLLAGTESVRESMESDQEKRVMALHWDFAGADLSTTLWSCLEAFAKKAGRPVSDTHPPGELRRVFIRAVFPPWVQEFGTSLSTQLSARLSHL